MKHKVIKNNNCYFCSRCKKASGDGDGLVGGECSGYKKISDCCGAEAVYAYNPRGKSIEILGIIIAPQSNFYQCFQCGKPCKVASQKK